MSIFARTYRVAPSRFLMLLIKSDNIYGSPSLDSHHRPCLSLVWKEAYDSYNCLKPSMFLWKDSIIMLTTHVTLSFSYKVERSINA